GAAPRGAAGRLVPGLLSPAHDQFRAGPADRLRVGRRVPRRPRSRAGGTELGAGRGGGAGSGPGGCPLRSTVGPPTRRGRGQRGRGSGGWRGLAAAGSNIVFLGVGGAWFGCRGASGEGRAGPRRSERPGAA